MIVKLRNVLAVIAVTFSLVSTVNAELCNVEHIQETTPIDKFIDHQDGSITDIETGLTWAKCSYGQTYNVGQCEGEPIHVESWGEALNVAKAQSSFLGKTGWRIPNIKELDTIVERRCVRPSINLVAFPNTPSAVFYSSTPDNTNPLSTFRAINFATGEDFFPEVSIFRFVRLVRESK